MSLSVMDGIPIMVLPKQLNIMYTILLLDVLFLVQNVLCKERSEM